MKKEYDPKQDDFDPYECWENTDCSYVEEATFGDPGNEDFEECLYCSAPDDYVCPLLKS